MRKKRSVYSRMHEEYQKRKNDHLTRLVRRLGYGVKYALRRYGDVDATVVRYLGEFHKLDDPIMPELYRTLDLHYTLKGTRPDENDVKLYYHRLREDMRAASAYSADGSYDTNGIDHEAIITIE